MPGKELGANRKRKKLDSRFESSLQIPSGSSLVRAFTGDGSRASEVSTMLEQQLGLHNSENSQKLQVRTLNFQQGQGYRS